IAHAESTEVIGSEVSIYKVQTYPVEYNSIPLCLYTSPEAASFGLSKEQAAASYEDVVVKNFAFAGNGKAIAAEETDGFVKIISERKYHQILGAVVVGSHATEMIHTILAVKEAEGTVDELAKTIFAHPTLSEVLGEAANSVFGKAIHA